MAPYYRELGVAFGLYGLVLVASILLLTSGRIESDMVRHAIALSPMLPGGLVCWAILRQMRRLDELQLRVQLEAVGFAFAVTALLTFSYGFLEGQGWPRAVHVCGVAADGRDVDGGHLARGAAVSVMPPTASLYSAPGPRQPNA